MQGLDYKVDVAKPRTWSFELSVSLWPVLSFVANCRFQLARCLTSQQLQTQFSISLLEWEHCMHDVVMSVWTSWAPQLSFIRNAYSSGFKHSYLFINHSLTHTVNTTRVLRFFSAYQWVLTLLSKDYVVQGWCYQKAEFPHLHRYCFSQNDNGVLCDACSNLWESSYSLLQSGGCYHLCYSLNSQTAFTFWFTIVHSTVFTFFQLICSL